MQDDLYELAADGWEVGRQVKRIEKKTKKGDKETIKTVAGLEGLEGLLIPPTLLIRQYFASEQKALEDLEASAGKIDAQMEELMEEHGVEDGLLANAVDEKGKISKGSLSKAIKETQEAVKFWRKRTPAHVTVAGTASDTDHESESDTTPEDELKMLENYKRLMDEESETQGKIKVAKAELESKVIMQYPRLSIDEIKTVVVEMKWIKAIEEQITSEMENISHRLTARIKGIGRPV